MRVITVDDEPLALSRLSDLLRQIDGVDLVGTYQSGNEALAAIDKLRPDLLLVDIEMPHLDGFDLVETLSRQRRSDGLPPWVCFVTAHPHFASESYETGALDFLCKPVRLHRLEKAVERARMAMQQRDATCQLAELTEQLEVLRRTHGRAEQPFLWLQQRRGTMRIAVAELDWVKSEAEYVRLHVGDSSFLLRGSIKSFAEHLSCEGFIQIHRSILINFDRLTAVRGARDSVKVVLESGVILPVGRKYRQGLRSLLESSAKPRF